MITRLLSLVAFWKLSSLRSSTFTDFYTKENTNGVSNTKVDQVLGEDMCYWIKNVEFSSLMNNRGMSDYMLVSGAIYFKSVLPLRVLIESCMLFNCSSGGIFFQNFKDGECVLYKVCGGRCHTEISDMTHGQFGWFQVHDTRRLIIFDVSVYKCAPSMTDVLNTPIYVQNSFLNMKNVNFSQNNAYQYSGMYMYYPNNYTCNYTIFADNFVTYSNCLYVYNGGYTARRNFFNCSFLRNNSPNNAVIELYSSTNDYFTFCLFQKNMNALFKTGGLTLQISFCYIYHTSTLVLSGPVSGYINSATTTQEMTYSIFSSYHCDPVNHIPQDVSPCQTLPPAASTCMINISEQSSQTLLSVFQLIMSQTSILILQ